MSAVTPEAARFVTRPAVFADAAAIAAIYNEGIADRVATFETEPRTPAQVAEWFRPGVLILVAETDGARVVAFAASFPYSPRPCYAGIGEYSVYAARTHRGRGAGRAVLQALIEAAREAGLHKLSSRIFPENTASRALMKALGFAEIGVHRRHGKLDGEWRDCVVVELLIEENCGVKRGIVVAALGSAQTLAWGSSYYLPAILADPIAGSLGISRTAFYAVFSGSLLLSGLLGPAVGRAIDMRGGRGILALSNLVLAAGLVLLALADGIAGLVIAWAVLGIGMAMGLYEPAFATLTGLYGRAARGPITGITLIAGFASTVGWPLSALLDAQYGWRNACLIWAALQILIGLPLNRLLIPPAPPPVRSQLEGEPPPAPRGAMPILAFVFAATGFVTGAMAAHLPHLLEIAGASATAAIAASALVGPAQVGARLIEFGALRLMHPLVSARLSTVLHPLGAAALTLFGPAAVMAFAVLHGAGNGLLTIARGTVPLAIFGPIGYGLRTGLLGAPARVTQALGPLLFGLLLDRMGVGSVAISAGLGIAAFAALLLLKTRAEPASATA